MDDGDLFLDGDVFPRFLRHAFHGRRMSVPRDLLLLLLLLLSDLQRTTQSNLHLSPKDKDKFPVFPMCVFFYKVSYLPLLQQNAMEPCSTTGMPSAQNVLVLSLTIQASMAVIYSIDSHYKQVIESFDE